MLTRVLFKDPDGKTLPSWLMKDGASLQELVMILPNRELGSYVEYKLWDVNVRERLPVSGISTCSLGAREIVFKAKVVELIIP